MSRNFPRPFEPRPEDAKARDLIARNRGTIQRLADQLSNGAYSAAKRAAAAPTEPAPAGLIMTHLGGPPPNDEPRPRVRISPNNRVVVIDEETSRQLYFLGELRRVDGVLQFVLATKANGFFAPLADDLANRLAGLDCTPLGPERSEAALAAELARCLDFAPTAPSG